MVHSQVLAAPGSGSPNVASSQLIDASDGSDAVQVEPAPYLTRPAQVHVAP